MIIIYACLFYGFTFSKVFPLQTFSSFFLLHTIL